METCLKTILNSEELIFNIVREDLASMLGVSKGNIIYIVFTRCTVWFIMTIQEKKDSKIEGTKDK